MKDCTESDWYCTAETIAGVLSVPDAHVGTYSVPMGLLAIDVAAAIEALLAEPPVGVLPRLSVQAWFWIAVLTSPNSAWMSTVPLAVNKVAVVVAGRFAAARTSWMPWVCP